MRLFKYIVGAVSGLTFGMLFAPKRGKDLRKQLKKDMDKEGIDRFEALCKAFKMAGEEMVDELQELSKHKKVSGAVKNSQQKIREFLEDFDIDDEDIERAINKVKRTTKKAVKKAKTAKKTVKKTVAKAKTKAKATKRKVKSVAKTAKTQAKKVKRTTKSAVKTVKKAAKKKVTTRKTAKKRK